MRYRLGGRAWPLLSGGTFSSLKDAKTRRDLVAGEIAAGRNPRDLLAAMAAEPSRTDKVSVWRDRFLASRRGVAANTAANYRTALKAACERFGDTDPARVTWQDVDGWVGELARRHKPATVKNYKRQFAILLDYVGVDPNPARDKRIQTPRRIQDEPNPPTADQFLAILDKVKQHRRRLMLIVLEQGALRVGEAVALRWGDVDRVNLRLRLPRSATKTSRSRFVYLPEWVFDALEGLCPPDDRVPDRRVFQGITESAVYYTMTRACRNAGVAHFHPHDLRHRRITVWHQSGVVARELAERAGHSRASMTLDIYSHVSSLDEAPVEALAALAAA